MATIQLRRGDAADWTTANSVLAAGEVGLEMDTGKFKWGDGTTAWNDLAYIGGGGGLPDGWSQDTEDPGNVVSTGGGGLSLGTDSVWGLSAGQDGPNGQEAFVDNTGFNADAYDDEGAQRSQLSAQSDGVTCGPVAGGSAFTAQSTFGGVAALDCGTLAIINLPTSDPHIAGALWNDGGTPAISTG